MFFFLASVAPEVRAVLARGAAACPRCGAPADAVELQQTLRVFALPVWRWGRRRGLACPSCGLVAAVDPNQLAAGQWPPRPPPPPPLPEAAADLRCPSCGALLAPNFKYCPQCVRQYGSSTCRAGASCRRSGRTAPLLGMLLSSDMQQCGLLLAAAKGQMRKCQLHHLVVPMQTELKAGRLSGL
eukprot:SM000159S01800  [mRNA]  locus=s159:189696:190784:- [translate_table: standard]